jgi:RNA polymerase sigma factor (sigma-70 family)
VSGEGLVERAAASFEAYRTGDRAEFDHLVELLTPLMWRTTRGAGLDRTSSEDVIQNVWMALLRSADGVRDPRTVVKWVVTSTRRESWRVAQRARTHDRRSAAVFGVDDEELMDLPTDVADGPDETVLRSERQQRLWAHVRELPERCRRLLSVIAFAERPDYAQIAESMGMPVGSIGPTRGRCLAKLRQALSVDQHWEGQLS